LIKKPARGKLKGVKPGSWHISIPRPVNSHLPPSCTLSAVAPGVLAVKVFYKTICPACQVLCTIFTEFALLFSQGEITIPW
jgi:hypothetical protein